MPWYEHVKLVEDSPRSFKCIELFLSFYSKTKVIIENKIVYVIIINAIITHMHTDIYV